MSTIKLSSDALKFENNQLFLLNQTQLPNTEEWILCDTPTKLYDSILQLKVRGAPLIAIAASLFIGKYALQIKNRKTIKSTIDYLISSRPTAVNLQLLLQQHLALLSKETEFKNHLDLAIQHFNEDIELCQKISRYGVEIIKDNDIILTHCNTGSLATAGNGTALGIIKSAFKTKSGISVYVDETRPLLQGARLTAWELSKNKIPYQLICDNMAAFLMKQNKVNVIVVGADRICLNGDFANKIGTYSLAVLAQYHNVPFYVAAPYTTIDFSCKTGESIPIEHREPNEVRGFKNQNNHIYWSPESSKVYNPAFDVTPSELVTGYILDKGHFSGKQLKSLACINQNTLRLSPNVTSIQL